MVNRKAEAPWSAPTSISRGLAEGVFCLQKQSAYDLEGLGAAARQKEKRRATFSDVQTGAASTR
ncbi:hypothetical protein D4T97_019860 [Siminovitchia acidinfaciens]|uniref:Uncharacterized protein n=1 Tax=Siminovitchia acidinfaciens TaxID=2321395 RepID=A0A429XT98_9BACI|nr:hypothetical protein D4T97_019860 [Siminovitchia acidinfaciens]